MPECLDCKNNYYDFKTDKFNDSWNVGFCIGCRAFGQTKFEKR